MDYDSIMESIQGISDNSALLVRFVNGSETETVNLGGKSTPSLRNMAKTVADRECRAADEMLRVGLLEQRQLSVATVEHATSAKTAAQSATQSAATATDACARAEYAAENIDLSTVRLNLCHQTVVQSNATIRLNLEIFKLQTA